ncbi:hypothetical protein CO015_04530 [candidate division WWE3 bacterium CG_4_8_14_3_um_filter_42_11]|uniref:Uncharacterized protein n=1 Tax=candidate division WWE3 bacterium CG_4_8_14_3_um_filter_42_11 TaxID=1975076 RepID=A0A2M8G650_UNCKA|nr:MAG: hypothetical protein CO015_04530 [candidate division WWE3 bacterium CG_4_8_14_3_um_filter_42_11]
MLISTPVYTAVFPILTARKARQLPHPYLTFPGIQYRRTLRPGNQFVFADKPAVQQSSPKHLWLKTLVLWKTLIAMKTHNWVSASFLSITTSAPGAPKVIMTVIP